MNFSDGNKGMFVEVTDAYREIFNRGNLSRMITGGGYGKIVDFDEVHSDWGRSNKLFKIMWSNGHLATMAPTHLQPSTKKAFFIQALRG